MLRSLEIHNYRNLRHLTIERLGRVNLLLGKNNTGKTSVLEAVAIHINRGSIDFLFQLLNERGENYIRAEDTERRNSEVAKEITILKTLAALFTGRAAQFNQKSTILIGEHESTLFGPETASVNRIGLRFVRFLEKYDYLDTDEKLSGPVHRRRISLPDDTDDPEALLGIEVRFNQSTVITPFRNIDRTARGLNSLQISSLDDSLASYQFVKTKNIEREINGALWDKIALTESEDEVVNALKIIESDIDRITFRNERERERVPVVKLKSSNDVVPLRSMGDGINRILTIILAMVNCENGYFLIDEFENGLHYSVQEKLWEVIFSVAERLNIQVFATTHSYDCIDAFSAILNSGRYPKESGCMIRLDNYEGDIEATLYNADEIQATTRVQVDPR
ncbi:AAA family ATPase [Larkinella sp.]|uniref:AAA family ATPase n=1 Tax=Larkinella sp. TaxID=2034517 RepID=UPI003BAC2327